MEQENINSMNEVITEIDETMKNISVGDILSGTVISVGENEVLVNIGYITDGIISKAEMPENDEVNAGDEIDVYVLKVNDGEGNVALSKKKADALKVWDELETLNEKSEHFIINVKEVVKGGVTADFKGVRVFIPASHVSASYVKDLSKFVGNELEVVLIDFDKEKKKVVASRKQIEMAELEVKKDQIWASIKKGEKRIGKVSRIAKFGAFIDLGGLDGLVHITQLSWERVKSVEDVVSVGDEVEVYVLEVDKEKNRISLSLKDVKGNPWDAMKDKFKVNQVVEGKVVKLAKFGAFVQIAPGFEGLVHLSEISEDRIEEPSDKLSVGDQVSVKILNIDVDSKRISLSIKEAVDNSAKYAEFMGQEEEGGTTLGDLFGDKLKDFFK